MCVKKNENFGLKIYSVIIESALDILQNPFY